MFWSKLNQIMKLTFLMTILSISMAFAADTYAQKTTLSLNMTEKHVSQVLDAIEQQSDFHFFYNNKLVDVNRLVSVKVSNENVFSILKTLFNGTNTSYKVVDKDIILTVKEQGVRSIDQTGSKISGVIVDSKGEPVIGANVAVKGTTNGTITDDAGKFTLTNAKRGDVLEISYIGYMTQDIRLTGQATLKILLKEDTKALDEVVVVGYGSVKKSNLTNSVSKITNESIADRPITTIGEAFQGQLSGVRSQSISGEPGKDYTIQIRGVNTINGDSSPLYVIDGVPRSNMSDINAMDIASIQVLKDASATSIYGARGANGVILIETKQGSGKPTVTFDGYYGIQQAEKSMDIMKTREYTAFNIYRRNLSYLISGGSMSNPMSSRPTSSQIPDWWYTANETDWQDAVLRNAPIQDYNISASSKGDMGNIYFSAGYQDQEGIIIETNYKKYNTRLNVSMNASSKLRFGLNFSAAISDKNNGQAEGKETPLHHALQIAPLVGLHNNTRDWGYVANLGASSNYPNPVERLKETKVETKYTRLATTLWGEYDILKDLQFKSSFSYNYDGSRYEFFQPGNVTYNNGNVSLGNSNSSSTNDWVVQNTLTYNKSFNDIHHLNVLLGQSAEQQNYYLIGAAATGWPYETISTLNKAATPTAATTSRWTYTNASFFGRVQYDYLEKYLFNASLRYDGSSRFGSNKQWGWFPSASVGWKINEESFMKDINWISLLKLRASWGTSGNDRIGNYVYTALLGTYNYSLNNALVSGVAPSNIPNDNLQWEQTRSTDFGFDFSIFKNRIQLNADYYVNKTTNLLFNMSTPYTTGFSSITENIGSIQNKGWEIDLTTHNLTGKFQWTTNLNLSRNRNKVLNMGGIKSLTSSSFDAYFITAVGQPISQFYAYKSDGLLKESDFDSNGKAIVPVLNATQRVGGVKYVDTNNDGKITSNDFRTFGNNLPDLTYGLTNRFSWKNFDLSILIQGQIGGNILWLGARQMDCAGVGFNQLSHWLRGYKEDYVKLYGDSPIPEEFCKKYGIDMSWDGKTPNAIGGWNINDDRRIYDATFLRIKNVTLSYTLPKAFLGNSLLKSVRVYLSADNLKTFDDYPGYTPESNSYGNSTTRMGVDYTTYPLSRRLIFGASLVF